MNSPSKKPTRYIVWNLHDGNQEFYVKAKTQHDACIEALNELGWVVSTKKEVWYDENIAVLLLSENNNSRRPIYRLSWRMEDEQWDFRLPRL